MPENPLKQQCLTVETLLQDYAHLKVTIRGSHIVIYSEEMGEKVNRCRLTKANGDIFMLGMADHRGKWESTPFLGTISELMETVTQQFGWVLENW